ncbi:hypothetical protein E2C01_030043 [Portunus trituberculatus]|uniref:Uncharacterized protein n=1 Tax=Portunus trituberculatus TaxID=210409 RepID=A0A5B7EPG0_PORTR|nr:hypothetical protein [Portunus trituberculatus]
MIEYLSLRGDSKHSKSCIIPYRLRCGEALVALGEDGVGVDQWLVMMFLGIWRMLMAFLAALEKQVGTCQGGSWHYRELPLEADRGRCADNLGGDSVMCAPPSRGLTTTRQHNTEQRHLHDSAKEKLSYEWFGLYRLRHVLPMTPLQLESDYRVSS